MKNISHFYNKLLMFNLKKNLQKMVETLLIELVQTDEIKPKKATNEQLEGYLANLYMGLLLLYEKIDNSDKQIIQEAVWNSGVLPIIQSIYYDTIGHYLQEMRDFVARVKIYEDAVIYVNDVIEKLIDDLERYVTELVNDLTVTSAAIDDYWDFVDGLRGALYEDAAALEEEEVENMYHLSEHIADCLEDLGALRNKAIEIENIPIRKWIECMLSIPRGVWKQFVKDVDTIEEAVHSIFSIFEYAQKYQIYPYLEDIDFGWPFQYMDAPYYNAFYNVFLPFWKLIESYQESPRLQLLKQIVQAIDHIKDLQHHSDFFWTSLQKETMDFISHAKISELIKYVTDSDIRKVYKKYRFKFKESLEKSFKLILIESLAGQKITLKPATNEQLKHYLANMYLGYQLLTSKQLDEKDKKLLTYETYISGVLPVVQSIFYDTIQHYNQEIGDFVSLGKGGIDIDYIERKVRRFLDTVEEKVDKREYLKLKKELENLVQSIKNILDVPNKLITCIWEWVDKHEHVYRIEDAFTENTFKTVDDWIKFMSSIPSKIWDRYIDLQWDSQDLADYFVLLIYILNNYDGEEITMENLYETADEDMNDENLSWSEESELRNTMKLFHYFDYPYYVAFYDNFLPLYNEVKKFQQSLDINTLNKIIIMIDHIKDLRHHSNVFWISLKKDTMDYISKAKSLSQLYQWATDPTIKSIYKRYRKLLGESLNKLNKEII